MAKKQNKIPDYVLNLLCLMMMLILLPGCEKVITVDLNEADPKIVIEGMITDQPGPYAVLVTKSGSYFGQPDLPFVSGAKVTITDNAGTTELLREKRQGVYLTTLIRGVAGRKYTLRVVTENVEYMAESTMPARVAIDSLALRKEDPQHIDFGDDGTDTDHAEVHCYFIDPPGKNFYRIRYARDDTVRNDYYRLYDDQYADGQHTELSVTNAHARHTYRVELLSVSREAFNYFSSLDDLMYSSPVFGSTPANPDDIFTNGALGYFAACAVDVKSITVTKAMLDRLK
jgi:hypothetical protein